MTRATAITINDVLPLVVRFVIALDHIDNVVHVLSCALVSRSFMLSCSCASFVCVCGGLSCHYS
jgi:hypothetical protein